MTYEDQTFLFRKLSELYAINMEIARAYQGVNSSLHIHHNVRAAFYERLAYSVATNTPFDFELTNDSTLTAEEAVELYENTMIRIAADTIGTTDPDYIMLHLSKRKVRVKYSSIAKIFPPTRNKTYR